MRQEAAAAHTAQPEQVRADAAREREELRDALESRSRILEESRDELRRRPSGPRRELGRLYQVTCDSQTAPAPPARRRRDRQGKDAEVGQ